MYTSVFCIHHVSVLYKIKYKQLHNLINHLKRAKNTNPIFFSYTLYMVCCYEHGPNHLPR